MTSRETGDECRIEIPAYLYFGACILAFGIILLEIGGLHNRPAGNRESHNVNPRKR
jgi:hypothetical protein